MKKPREETPLALLNLIDLDELQQMQDSFSEAADITIRTTDTCGKFLTEVSRMPTLCKEVFLSEDFKKEACGQCLPSFLGGEGIVDDELSYECLPGFKKYLVPLKISLAPTKSLILGYMIIGPIIFMKRKDKDEVLALASELGIDFENLWNQFLELRVFSYKGIHSLLDMIENLTKSVLNLAYAKVVMQKKMQRKFSDIVGAKSLDKTKSSDEFLKFFLDLAMSLSKGSKGSVMVLDANKNRLTIQASCGIPQDIISTTSLKVGEGIAGLAAETKKSFLINKQNADQLIADRLKKPEISSSLVIPIRYRDLVYGVLNISADESSLVEFDESNLAFLSKAAGLAGVALHHFKN